MRPKPMRRDLDFDFFAELGISLDAPGVKDGNLVMLGGDFFRDNEFGESLDVAGFSVNGAAEFARRADRLFGSRSEGLPRRRRPRLPG